MDFLFAKKRISIAVLVIFIIVSVISALLATLGFSGNLLFSKKEFNELRLLNSLQADQASIALAPALWNFDQTQTEQIVESFLKDKRVYAIVVRDADSAGVVLAMVRDSRWQAVQTKKPGSAAGMLSQQRQISYQGKKVGNVQILVTPFFLNKNLANIRLIISLTLFLVAALLSLALYFLLWHIVLKPIKKLDQYARAVRLEAGETSHFLTTPFLGELETLRTSIANMITQLKSRSTELQEQAISLSESETKYHTLFDAADDAILLLEENRFVECNDRTLVMYGVSRDQIVGQTPDRFSPDKQPDGKSSRDKVMEKVSLALEGEPQSFEWLHRRDDGTVFDAEVSLTRIQYLDKIQLLAIVRDITERKRAEEALRERESQLQAIFESSRDAIGVAKAGVHIYANPAYLELFGFMNNNQIRGTSIINSIALSHRAQMIRRMQRRSAGEEVETFYESRGLRTDGTEFDAEFSLSTYTLRGEIYSVASIHDITERKHAENALRVSEGKFKAVIDNSSDSILFCDVDGRVLYRSPRARETGYSDAERLGKIAFDIVYPDDMNAVREAWNHAVQRKNDSTKVEFRTRRKDGAMIFVDATIQNLLDNPNLGALVVSMCDITDRKQAEALLRATHEQLKASDQQLRATNQQLMASLDELGESEERFRQMAENIEEIFFLYQKEGNKLLYMSPTITKLFGVPLEAISADPQMIDRAVHPDDQPHVKFTDFESFYSTSINEEFRIITKKGAVRWIRLRSFLIHGPNGAVVRVAGLAADITDFKNAQEEAVRRQQQLIQADKMASLGVMVSGIAHEINNPNNFITMSMPLLREAWESMLPIIKQHLKQGGTIKIGSMGFEEFMQNFDQLMNGITEGSQRIKRIVSDLKDYARLDTSDMNRIFDLNQVTQSAVNLMNNMIRKRTKAFSLELSKGRLPAKGNAQRLEQVIVNLIHNACDALTSTEQLIIITTNQSSGNRIALVITDQGCGIAPGDLSKITDPFYTTKRDKGGTGLGLSISAGIVKDHGGELQFQSEQGKGTTVTLLLPLGAQVQ